MKFALKLPAFPAKAAPVTGAGSDANAGDGSLLARVFERKRMLRVAVLFIIAGSAGQIMQLMQARHAMQRQAAVAVQAGAVKPVEIMSLSGSSAATATAPAQSGAPPTGVMLAAAESAAMVVPVPPRLPLVTPASAMPEVAPAPPIAPAKSDCTVVLDLAAMPGAMIGVTLLAPCAPNARVVLQHEGLAVTGLTTATGSMITTLPALTTQAKVTAVLADGSKVETALTVTEAADFRRFGVQWQGDDAFQVMAYENGAGFGAKGHVYGAQPGMISDAGGFLQVLGNPAAPMPLLAEVYTYPKAQALVDLVVESAVTATTCGRELLGETLMAADGKVLVTDLTLAMPDCAAIGDFLVLNNLALDMTLAAN